MEKISPSIAKDGDKAVLGAIVAKVPATTASYRFADQFAINLGRLRCDILPCSRIRPAMTSLLMQLLSRTLTFTPSLSKWRGGENVLALNDDVAPTLCPRHRVVEQPALVLDNAAELVRPYNHDPIEFSVLGLLHRHSREEM